jgi:hypothetical protein
MMITRLNVQYWCELGGLKKKTKKNFKKKGKKKLNIANVFEIPHVGK